MKKLVLAASAILMATSSAWGARSDRGSDRTRLVSQTEVIRLGGTEYQQESIIRIRQALKRQGVSMEGKAIKSVTVVAKSRQGRGMARLLVGRDQSSPKTVGVDTRADRRSDRRSLRRLFEQKGGMNRLTLSSPVSVQRQLRQGTGAVRVQLNGNIKVARIKVELVSKAGPGKRLRKRSDEEIVIDIIGEIIGGIVENERDKKRRGRP